MNGAIAAGRLSWTEWTGGDSITGVTCEGCTILTETSARTAMRASAVDRNHGDDGLAVAPEIARQTSGIRCRTHDRPHGWLDCKTAATARLRLASASRPRQDGTTRLPPRGFLDLRNNPRCGPCSRAHRPCRLRLSPARRVLPGRVADSRRGRTGRRSGRGRRDRAAHAARPVSAVRRAARRATGDAGPSRATGRPLHVLRRRPGAMPDTRLTRRRGPANRLPPVSEDHDPGPARRVRHPLALLPHGCRPSRHSAACRDRQ